MKQDFAPTQPWRGVQHQVGKNGLTFEDVFDLKHSIKSAVCGIATDSECGGPLLRQLDGLWKYRVRRFRIVYAIDHKRRVIRLVAVGHRRHVYEEFDCSTDAKDVIESCDAPSRRVKSHLEHHLQKFERTIG